MKPWLTILLVIIVLAIIGVIIAVSMSPQTTLGDGLSDDLNGQTEYNETEAMSAVDDVFITDDETDTVEIGELVE